MTKQPTATTATFGAYARATSTATPARTNPIPTSTVGRNP